MTRLHSYFTYVTAFLPLVAVFFGIVVFSSIPGSLRFTVLFCFCFVAMSSALLYGRKRVFYENGELYIGNLFSNKLKVVRRDRFGSIERAYCAGTYKIIYYDDDNNVKYAYFSLNTFIPDGEEIIDKLNEVNES